MKQVSVVSDLCVDILVRGNVTPRYNQEEQLVDDYALELGGSAAIFASQLAKLGGLVRLYGMVGDDLFGEYLDKRLSSLGIARELQVSEQMKTSVGLGLVRGGDRAMLTYDQTIRGLDPHTVFTAEFMKNTEHLHICSYFLLSQFQSEWPEIIRKLRENDVTVSLDTNWAPEGDWYKVRDILPMVDVFLPNEQEAIQVAGRDDLEEAGRRLAEHCPLVVIKCGENGARVFSKEGRQHFPVPDSLTDGLKIADTTGAGDSFDGGFIFGWLSGRSLEECVGVALRCGTLSLREIGGISGQMKQ